jgi:hypothetical protein
MVGDVGEHIGEPRLRVDIVHFLPFMPSTVKNSEMVDLLCYLGSIWRSELPVFHASEWISLQIAMADSPPPRTMFSSPHGF